MVDNGSLGEPLAACSLPEQYQEQQFPAWACSRAHAVSWEVTCDEFSDLNTTAGKGEKMVNPYYQRLPSSSITLRCCSATTALLLQTLRKTQPRLLSRKTANPAVRQKPPFSHLLRTRVSGYVSKKQKENIFVSPGKEGHKPTFPLPGHPRGQQLEQTHGLLAPGRQGSGAANPTSTAVLDSLRQNKMRLPHSSQPCTFGPVPTSCKNLHPENNQPGNASNCAPGLGPQRSSPPPPQRAPRGRERAGFTQRNAGC